jgi:hypothetical protein
LKTTNNYLNELKSIFTGPMNALRLFSDEFGNAVVDVDLLNVDTGEEVCCLDGINFNLAFSYCLRIKLDIREKFLFIFFSVIGSIGFSCIDCGD